MLLPLLHALLVVGQAAKAPFEDEIEAFEAQDRVNPPKKGGILFTGSSSIRIWTSLREDFPGRNVINRGFGGSQVSDSVRYVHRIVTPYAPKTIVFYAGTNDIAAGKSADTVFADYRAYVREVRTRLPKTTIFFVSISPAPSRWAKWGEMSRANVLVRDWSKGQRGLGYIDLVPAMLDAKGQPRPELFGPDMLHMNPQGYVVWKGVIGPRLPRR